MSEKAKVGDWVLDRREFAACADPFKRIVRLGRIVDEPGEILCRVDWGTHITTYAYANLIKIEFKDFPL